MNNAKEELCLSPDLSGKNPGGDLYTYFKSRLPDNLSQETYDRLSCFGFAKLIVGELGGTELARIVEVERQNNPDDPHDICSHGYVVPIGARDADLAYNNDRSLGTWWILTVGEVKALGEDVTEEMMELPWEWL